MLMRAGDPSLLVDQAAEVVECAEPGCHARPVVGGLCRRDYGRRWRRANAAAIAVKRRERHLAEPAPAPVLRVEVLCGCGGRMVTPAGEIGLVVGCVRCGRALRPTLLPESVPRVCLRCGVEMPADSYVTTRYCSTSCRVLAKEARRAGRGPGRRQDPVQRVNGGPV